MQELTVASVEKITPRKEGAEPFYVVKGQGGEEMTTFDAAALGWGAGTKLNVDIKVKGKYTNIAKWEMLQLIAASSAPQTSTNPLSGPAVGDSMTPEMWEEKDRIKCLSIERQSSAATILTYAAAQHADGTAIAGRYDLAEAVEKAIAWLSSRFDDTPGDKLTRDVERVKQINEQVDQRTQADEDFDKLGRDSRFTTVGELRKWCSENDVNTVKFCELVHVKESEIPKINIDEAHQVIKDYLAGKGG